MPARLVCVVANVASKDFGCHRRGVLVELLVGVIHLTLPKYSGACFAGFRRHGMSTNLLKQMVAPVGVGVVLAVPVAFYQAQQVKEERADKAAQDKIDAARAKQFRELQRCQAALDSVDTFCARYTMGAHCVDSQCLHAIEAVVKMGASCNRLLEGFEAAQRSGVAALMHCSKDNQK